MTEDLLAKYESEVARLHKLQLSLDVELRQLKWILIGGAAGASSLAGLAARRAGHESRACKIGSLIL